MAEQTFTPGPWEWCYRTNENENDGSVFWMKREGHAYCVAKAPRYQTKEQWAADARLIAASPLMLEALELACNTFRDLDEDDTAAFKTMHTAIKAAKDSPND